MLQSIISPTLISLEDRFLDKTQISDLSQFRSNVFEQISGSMSSAPIAMVEVRSGRYFEGLSKSSND